jgi:hypothetical protein
LPAECPLWLLRIFGVLLDTRKFEKKMEQDITVRSKLHMINPMWLMLQQSSMLAKFFSPFFSQMPPYDLTPAPVFHWLVEYNVLMSLFIYSAVIHCWK